MRYAFAMSAFRVLGKGVIKFGLKTEHGLMSGYGSAKTEEAMTSSVNAAALEKFPVQDGWEGHNVAFAIIPEKFWSQP